MTKNKLSNFEHARKIKSPARNYDKFQALNLKIKTLESGIKNSEELYKKLIMTSNDAIFIVDKEGTIIFNSEKAIGLFGYEKGQNMYGINLTDLVIKSEKQRIFDDIKRVFKEGFIGNLQYTFLKSNNKKFTGLVNAAKIKGTFETPFAFIMTLKDITKQKEMDIKEELYKLIFNKVNDGIVLHTVENKKVGKFFDANEIACKMVGYEKEELLNKTPFDLYAKISKKEINSLIEKFNTEETVKFETQIQRKDKTKFICEVNSQIIQYKNKPAVLSIVRDITEKKSIEKEVHNNLIVIKKILDGIINAMEKLVERKDRYTVGHQRRTAELSKFIAKKMGFSEKEIEGIYIAALIHDIGKIFISGKILNKIGKLTKREYEIIKRHPEEGYDILKTIYFPWPIAEIIYQHHERINGSGYPKKLKGNQILTQAKIIGIADVIEAMTFERPYRKGLGINKALEEIEKNKGILYDKKISELCINIFKTGEFRF